jgi:hypothetical protein
MQVDHQVQHSQCQSLQMQVDWRDAGEEVHTLLASKSKQSFVRYMPDGKVQSSSWTTQLPPRADMLKMQIQQASDVERLSNDCYTFLYPVHV